MKKILAALTLTVLMIYLVIALAPAAGALDTPTLSVTGTTDTTVSLSWTDAGNENSYSVYKNGVFLVSVGAHIHAFTATGLTPATAYTFRVDAIKNANVRPSNTVSVTTLGGPPPTTTTTVPPPTTTTTVPPSPTTTTTVPPPPTTTTTVPPPPTTTTTVPPPPGCTGVQVAPGTGLPAAMAGASGARTFCLSAGTYTLNTQPAFENGDVIQGAGINATFLVHNNSNGKMFSFAGTGPYSTTMRDLDIKAPFIAPPACASITCGGAVIDRGAVLWERVRCHDAGVSCIAYGANNTTLVDVECIHNGYHPAGLDPATRSSSCVKQNVGSVHVFGGQFNDNAWVALWCDFCDGGEFIVDGATFLHNGRGGIQYEVSGHFVPGDHGVIRNSTFHDGGWNTSVDHGGGHAAIICSDCSNFLVETNTFGGNLATDLGGGGFRAVWVLGGTRQPGPQVNVVIQNNTLNGDRIKGCELEGVTCTNNI